MKVKVSFFDKTLLKNYLFILSSLSVVLSFVLIAVDIPNKHRFAIGIVLFILLFITYFIMWIRANLADNVNLSINNSVVNIKIGNIFEENELKVIPFNEYFDTCVDNVIISDKTLNGMYIKNVVADLNNLDSLIDNDYKLNEKIININEHRMMGKNKQYNLGSIYQHEDYLLTAFAKFDENNRAYLHMNDYINFLINFWNEIDIVYGGRTVAIPLLGSGITRFKGYSMVTEQELLELLIWTFKVSRIKFTHPSCVSIIIHESKKDKINFYRLRSVENGL
ncbi:macro domain-containing protein [Planomicrobium sp. CPCC 101079]|uniref:macro domain-containing protein n=1 Tax=Planomicrobium sp. CPCC 101079 TaxID=2599618 RepID=UPI0011B454A9|nr:macro domain-containing protein [Planomicrobium sp. CPCC 101079]TWT01578.1 hypothetical protein FQV28_16030 [Planomicrobium sp. CPCC 101079]